MGRRVVFCFEFCLVWGIIVSASERQMSDKELWKHLLHILGQILGNPNNKHFETFERVWTGAGMINNHAISLIPLPRKTLQRDLLLTAEQDSSSFLWPPCGDYQHHCYPGKCCLRWDVDCKAWACGTDAMNIIVTVNDSWPTRAPRDWVNPLYLRHLQIQGVITTFLSNKQRETGTRYFASLGSNI